MDFSSPFVLNPGAPATAGADAPGEELNHAAADLTPAAVEPTEEESKSTVVNRMFGGVQALWGAGQAIGGTAFAIGSAETVVGAVAGAAIAAHGVDDFQGGIRQMWSGKPVENATQTLATEAAKKAGASLPTAMVIGAVVDAAAGGPGGGAKKTAEKFAKEMMETEFRESQNLGRQLNELERGGPRPEGTHKIQGPRANARTSASNKSSEILAKQLERAGRPRPSPNHDAHHVLPFNDPRVASLRTDLEKLGVTTKDLNSPANLAWLPRGSQAANVQGAARHEFTFSDKYVADLKDRLKGVGSPEEALGRLREFGNALENGDWPPIGSWPWTGK